MKLEYVPLLQVQRDLYGMARGGKRFEAYIETLRDEAGEMALPLGGMNPMGKGHLPELLDDYLGLGGERLGEEATAVAATDLADIVGSFQTGLVLVDDLHGGWTNRYAVEFTHLCGTQPLQRRGWLVGHLWSSEAATAVGVFTSMLLAIFRGGYIVQHGFARTLGEVLAQEKAVWRRGAAAGAVHEWDLLDGDDWGYTGEVLAPYLGSDDQGVLLAALFGDGAARELGYRPLGVSVRAGLRWCRQVG